jgi:hypothetical protein
MNKLWYCEVNSAAAMIRMYTQPGETDIRLFFQINK